MDGRRARGSPLCASGSRSRLRSRHRTRSRRLWVCRWLPTQPAFGVTIERPMTRGSTAGAVLRMRESPRQTSMFWRSKAGCIRSESGGDRSIGAAGQARDAKHPTVKRSSAVSAAPSSIQRWPLVLGVDVTRARAPRREKEQLISAQTITSTSSAPRPSAEHGLGGGSNRDKRGPDRRANLRPHHAENQKPKRQRRRAHVFTICDALSALSAFAC